MRKLKSGPRRRTGLIVAGSVLAVVAIAGAGAVAVRSSGSEVDSYPTYAGAPPQPTSTTSGNGNPPTTDATHRPAPPKHRPAPPEPPSSGLHPGSPVTSDRLRQINPTLFFYEMLKRQAMVQITDLTSEHFEGRDQRLHRDRYDSQVGRRIIEYPGLRTSEASTWGAPGDRNVERCIDGKLYTYFAFSQHWVRTDGDLECRDLTYLPQYNTDGITPGGLTARQADRYIAQLKAIPGFIHPRQPRLMVDRGHRYIRMVLDVTPVKGSDGYYTGALRLFDYAYKQAGLPTHPYIFLASVAPLQGVHGIYYIDPETLLPAYSKMIGTDTHGRPSAQFPNSHVFQYRYPARMPVFTMQDHDPVVLDPPEGFTIY